MSANDDESGFSLIEVLVALAVLAFGLAAILQSVSASLEVSARAEDRVRATLEAQSRLAALPVDAPQAAGRRAGASDRGRWEMEVTATESGLALVAVTVHGGRASVTLTTLRPLAAR